MTETTIKIDNGDGTFSVKQIIEDKKEVILSKEDIESKISSLEGQNNSLLAKIERNNIEKTKYISYLNQLNQ